MAQFQRDVKIIEALYNIALQPAGVGHQLGHAEDLCPLQRHAPRHDKPDIAAAQDHDPPPGEIPFHVDEPLRRACGKDARRAVARDVQRTARALTAAHGQNHGLGVQLEQAVRFVHGRHGLIRRQIQHHGVELILDAQRLHLRDEPCGVLGAGQFFFEGMQPETVVDALVQDAAQLTVALQNQNVLHAVFACRHGCRQPGRAAADDDQIYIFHCRSPPFKTHLYLCRR